MTRIAFRKYWLLCELDGIAGLAEIQRNDELMLAATDDEAVRRARCEARSGCRHALGAVARHQHAKHRCRAYRMGLTGAEGGRS